MRRALATVAAVSFMAAAGGAHAADQFDLLCTGTVKQRANGKPSPYQKTYRIDIATNRWCVDACAQAGAIFAVTASKLTLMEATDSSKSTDGSALTHEIDRTSGALVDFQYRPPLFANSLPSWWEVRGTCEPRPFSGIPTAKF